MRENSEPRLKNKKNIFHYQVFSALCSVFCVLILLSGCSKEDKVYKESRMVMDTLCTITVVSPSEEKAREAINAGFARIKKIEQLLNFFSPESELTAINRASGSSPVKVNKETLEIIKKAVEIADYTNGAFDPTIGPVIKLWRFSRQTPGPSIPSIDEIKNALRFVDYKKIKINISASEVFLEKKGMKLDLGGILKGYAADMAIEAIKAKGIKAALVAIAGDIKGFGLKPDMKPWKVGIQSPRLADNKSEMKGKDIFASLYLKDKAISTSGDYQRFFIKQGRRYHHILDPRVGYSVSDVISVSVIAPHGFMADGLSTGIFVLGAEKGIKLLESMGLSGVIVDSNNEIFITKDLKGKINFENNT